MSVDPLAEITVSPYAYVWNNPINYADPSGMMGEKKGGEKPGPKTIKDCFGADDGFGMSSRKPGDPRSVQVYQYNVVKGANGWNVYRNSQLDKTVTRIEGRNWKGAEESHFSVLKNGKWKDYESYSDFSKDYPNHTLQGMPAKEIAKLSTWATKEVAKDAWNNPESQAVLLMPVFALGEIFAAGSIVEGAGYSGNITKYSNPVKHLTKRLDEGWAFRNTNDMLRYARSFFSRSGKNISQFTDQAGHIHRIDIVTQEYGVMTSEGVVQTVFRVTPKANSNFKNAQEYLQIQKQLWKVK